MPASPRATTCPSCGAINVGDFANCLRCQAPLSQPAPAASALAAPPAPAPTPAPAAAPARPYEQPAAPAPPRTSAACPHCGAALQPGDRFCTACGRSPAAATGAQPAWQQPAPVPPQAHYYQQQQYANNSGTGGAPPPEVGGWNWGAFFWTWLWGIAHGVWNSFLVLILGLIWQIVLGAKGTEWAWKSRRFTSVQQFKDTQRAWAIWGWVFFFLYLIGTVIVVILVMGAVAAGQLDLGDLDF